MKFTTSVIAAILATSTYATPLAARDDAAPSITITASYAAAATSDSSTSSAASPKDTLLTQKLLLADTAADRYALLPSNTQFQFDFNQPKGLGGKGGDLFAANRKTFPALVGTSSGMAVGFLGPCGFNTPHIHPRATELQIVVEGKVITEMLPENGVFNVPGNATSGRRVIRTELSAFQMTPFYQGSVHTQFNPSCDNATFIASFNSEDFGTGQVADELFAFDDMVVQAAFGQAIDGADVDKFRKNIPASIAKGVSECLTTCGIAARR
ncbi:RmlC-like cupin domain-containing protein [Calycina marina]|uniref:RmlC-like cupin domain-containing protein n=1 Tax=Calycina marina TaxID=1763456 RepID=A0A9P7Z5F3_9HELO|nr:RmlC-like cupin domain-containing protein [Calycina marina]